MLRQLPLIGALTLPCRGGGGGQDRITESPLPDLERPFIAPIVLLPIAIALYDELSVSRAARLLGMSQPAVTAGYFPALAQRNFRKRRLSRHGLACLMRAGLGGEAGSIEPGKRADIVAVPGDPLRTVDVLARAAFVMKAGRVVRNDLTPPRVR